MRTPPAQQAASGANPGLAHGVFQRVVCGVDATPQSLTAVRQADQLRAEDGELAVVSALDIDATAHAGWAATYAAKGLRAEAEAALKAARAAVPDASFELVEGRPDQALLAEANQLDATLVAVGTHGISRPIGIALSSGT